MTTDEAGVPRIVGTPLKVIEIDLDRLHMIDWHMIDWHMIDWHMIDWHMIDWHMNGQRMKSVGNIPV